MTEVLEPNALERWQREPTSFIAEVLRKPDGKPFELFDAQSQFFEHAWKRRDDGRLLYPEQCIGWIKKTGKGGTAAMHGLVTLLIYGGKFAEGYCIAADLQQAQERVFGEIKRICECSPLLKRECEITASRITFPQTGATITALAGDYASAAGGHPTWVNADEVWTFTTERNRRFYEEMCPVPTQPISVRLITTHAGFSGECELLEEIHARGMALPEIAGTNLRAGNGMLFTWSHSPLAEWQKVDGSHEAWLAEMRASTRPLRFLQQYENRFVSGEGTFITTEMYDKSVKLSGPHASDPKLPVIMGVDAGWLHDDSALITVTPKGDGNVDLVRHRIFTPSPTDPLDFEQTIEREILDVHKQFHLKLVVIDPTQMVYLAQRLRTLGLPIKEFKQGDQSAMIQNLLDMFRSERFSTYQDQKMRHNITGTILVETKSGLRFADHQSVKKDATAALGMAGFAAVQNMGKPGYDRNYFGWSEQADREHSQSPKPPSAPPEPELSDELPQGGDWWRWKKIPRQTPTHSANGRLLQGYKMLAGPSFKK
jgi:terminase large subunit-like protein